MDPREAPPRLYQYTPSAAAALIFIILFSCTALFHTFQFFKNRTWYFLPFLIGGFFEPVGYVGRLIGAKQVPNFTSGPFIDQTLLILLAPTLFAASVYMILGRLIRITDGEQYSLIPAKWLTKVFVGGDVLSFLAQAAGGTMLSQAKTTGTMKNAENIITGGLALQVIFFGFFIVTTILFHVRIVKNPTSRSMALDVPWRRFLFVMYGAGGLILLRSIFRVAEYTTGQNGPLLKTETYLYIFDATLMYLLMVLFNVFHPSSIISKRTLDQGQGWPTGEPKDSASRYATISSESMVLQERKQMV